MFGSSGRGGGGGQWSLCLVALGFFCATGAVNGLRSPPLVPIGPSEVLPERDDVSLRLPNDTIPIHYEVHFNTRVHAQEFVYSGTVDIDILCVEPTSTIVMHSRLITISRIALKTATGDTELTNFSMDEETEFLTIQLNTPLVKDQEITLTMTFTGEHATDNVGWYRASYTNDNGQEVYVFH